MNVDIIEKSKKNIDGDLKVTCPKDILKIKDVKDIRNAVREHLLFIGLDNRYNVRNLTLLGIGTTCNVIIDTKEIVRTALYSASEKVILVHNHPANNTEPSEDDYHITSVTNEMLNVFNIKLLDHIIVTEKDYISMGTINKLSNKKYIEDISNIEKGLLLEENKKLKQEIYELKHKQELVSEMKVISAEYEGNYNDTTVYNVEISKNGKNEYVTLEKRYIDMEEKSEWEVFSNIVLSDKETNTIIDIVSKKPPTMFIDAPPTIYENVDVEEIEMEG